MQQLAFYFDMSSSFWEGLSMPGDVSCNLCLMQAIQIQPQKPRKSNPSTGQPRDSGPTPLQLGFCSNKEATPGLTLMVRITGSMQHLTLFTLRSILSLLDVLRLCQLTILGITTTYLESDRLVNSRITLTLNWTTT